MAQGASEIISSLFHKILGSSNEISGATYIPDEPKSKKFDLNKSRVFKFNDLNNDGPFLAIRLEGDRVSVQERLKDISKELELKKDNLLIKYNEAIELIEEEFKANAGPLEDLLFKARAIKAMESEYIQDEMFEKIVYN